MIRNMQSALKPHRVPRYKNVTDQKADGATYTPNQLAKFVASQIVSQLASVLPVTPLRVLDPAIGEGALLVSLLNQLRSRGIEDLDVYGFETDEAALRTATDHLGCLFPCARLHFSKESFLDFVDRVANRDSLFGFDPSVEYDLVIANPPYVRTQVLGAGVAQSLARQYGLTGRV